MSSQWMSVVRLVCFLPGAMCCLSQGFSVAGWRRGRHAERTFFSLHVGSVNNTASKLCSILWSNMFFFSVSCTFVWRITHGTFSAAQPSPHYLCALGGWFWKKKRVVVVSRSSSGHGCCEQRRQRCWERAPRCRLCDLPLELHRGFAQTAVDTLSGWTAGQDVWEKGRGEKERPR